MNPRNKMIRGIFTLLVIALVFAFISVRIQIEAIVRCADLNPKGFYYEASFLGGRCLARKLLASVCYRTGAATSTLFIKNKLNTNSWTAIPCEPVDLQD